MALHLLAPASPANEAAPGIIWQVSNDVVYVVGDHVTVTIQFLAGAGGGTIISSNVDVTLAGQLSVQGWFGWNWNDVQTGIPRWADWQQVAPEGQAVAVDATWSDSTFHTKGHINVIGFTFRQISGAWENLKQLRLELSTGTSLSDLLAAVQHTYQNAP